MDDSPADNAALDLLWSLWSELGVPGPKRNHRNVIADPERLLVATAGFAKVDARLEDLAYSWCVQHHERISTSRLAAVLEEVPTAVRNDAKPFLAELASVGIRWAGAEPGSPRRERDLRDLSVDLSRPALLRFRVRAFVGVGGRADVLVALLAREDRWSSAASLVEDAGLAKRNVARVLSDLAEAGIADARARGNVHEFTLAAPGLLRGMLGIPGDASFPDWRLIFEWMRLAAEIRALPKSRPATRLTKVAALRDVFVAIATSLRLEGRAPRIADRDVEPFVSWVEEHARAIASGRSTVVRGLTPGAARTR